MDLKEFCESIGLEGVPVLDDRRTLKLWKLACDAEPRFDEDGNRLMPLLLTPRYEPLLRRIFDLIMVSDEFDGEPFPELYEKLPDIDSHTEQNPDENHDYEKNAQMQAVEN